MGFSMSKDSEKEWENYSKNLQKNTKKNVKNVDNKVMPQTSYVYTSYDKKATAEVTKKQNDAYWEYVKKNPLGFEKSDETEKEWEKYAQNLRKRWDRKRCNLRGSSSHGLDTCSIFIIFSKKYKNYIYLGF